MTVLTRDASCPPYVGASQEKGRLGQWFDNVRTHFADKARQRRDREAFEHMLSLDDAILRDIGVTRADVVWANKLPTSENAAQELQKIALQNRRNGNVD